MTKKILNVWVCDYSDNTGEGRLARLFIQNLKLNQTNLLKFNQKKKLKINIFHQLWVSFFVGKNISSNEKVCYLNYLPFGIF